MKKTLILGYGYVGSALANKLPDAVFTCKSVQKAEEHNGIYFNLDDLNSWGNIPAVDDVIWTLPAAPLNLVQKFHTNVLHDCNRIVAYGSTSCYLTTRNEEIVTEEHPLDLSRVRVAGEEFLRKAGATILVLSGIYGPNREPVNWLRKGLIRSLDKRVNLIHRDDIVDITLFLLHENKLTKGERINLCDGVNRLWSEIAGYYSVEIKTDNTLVKNKIISNQKLRGLLPEAFQFRELYRSSYS
jgi:nucleoside-diphosphate-sugar epimerase